MGDAYDFVVIGGGSAGEAAASTAGRRGASVALVEQDLVGGSCPFWACMPSKSLLHAASVRADGGRYPWRRAASRRDEVIERGETAEAPSDASHVRDLERDGVTLVRGHGRIAGPGRVVVGVRPATELRSRFIVVATGSAPTMPDIEGLDAIDAWTSREATATRVLPRSLVVLGAGATGIELAQVFARYGVPTTLIASGPRIFPKGHPRDAAALDATLRQDGVRIRTGVRAVRARAAGGSEAHVVELTDGSAARGHAVLVAVGQTPQLDGLGLETVGVDTTKGRLAVGADLRVADGVFVAGDAAGREMYSHLAHYEGRMAVRIALGDHVLPDRRAIPRAVYTDPAVAEVGLRLDEARDQGYDAFEVSIDLGDTAKGIAAEAAGQVTIVADRARRTLLGAFVAGPAAAEAIQEAVLVIGTGTTLDVLADTIHAFPTLTGVLGDLFAEAAARCAEGDRA